MNENVKKEKNIFSLVISIMTLAVMSLGTSFAFFSSVVRSEEQAKVGSINFKLSAKIEPLYNTKKIIPTNDEDIMKAFNNECIDKYGWGACYAYNIKIVGEGEPQDVYGKFRFDAEEIPNLKYLILDADEKDEFDNYVVYKQGDYVKKDYEYMGEKMHFETDDVRNFILVVWLSNLEKPQDEETDKTFTGYLEIESTLGSKITGSINANVNNS